MVKNKRFQAVEEENWKIDVGVGMGNSILSRDEKIENINLVENRR